jgi:hypothetical protein
MEYGSAVVRIELVHDISSTRRRNSWKHPETQQRRPLSLEDDTNPGGETYR